MDDDAHDLALGRFTRLKTQLLQDIGDHRRRIAQFNQWANALGMVSGGDAVTTIDHSAAVTLNQLIEEGEQLAARAKVANLEAAKCGQRPISIALAKHPHNP